MSQHIAGHQFEDVKKLLQAQIRLDIATTLHRDPHMTEDRAKKAYDTLASPESVDQMVKELAREELQDAVKRGDVPGAALIYLAGIENKSVGRG